jgi:hypothetical protein
LLPEFERYTYTYTYSDGCKVTTYEYLDLRPAAIREADRHVEELLRMQELEPTVGLRPPFGRHHPSRVIPGEEREFLAGKSNRRENRRYRPVMLAMSKRRLLRSFCALFSGRS